MRRPNGTGTVYKMKHKRLRKPYRALVIVGWNDNGTPIRKSLGSFERAKDAYAALDAYTANPAAVSSLSDVTFAQCWAWGRADKVRKGITANSLAVYDGLISRMSKIMKKRIVDLRVQQLQSVIDANSDLNPGTLEKIKTIMHSAFNAAIKQEIVDKDYAKLLVMPARIKSQIHKPFSNEDIYTLWQNIDNKVVKILLIYIYTGLRPSELYNIKLENVHLSERYMIGGMKTDSGKNRIVPIAECIYPFISELYTLSKFKRSATLIPDEYISPRLRYPLQRICNELKLEKHIPHDLRHTFVTLARNADMDIYVLKKVVGHKLGDITDVYTHKTRQQLIDAVNTLPFKEKLLIKGCAVVEQQT